MKQRRKEILIPWPPIVRAKLPRGISEDISLSDLARTTGLSLSLISRVFGGTRRPSLRSAAKIAAYLKMPIDKLYKILEKNRQISG